MTNTQIRVTPGSRSNFSKLRKYKGGGVPKFRNPNGALAMTDAELQNRTLKWDTKVDDLYLTNGLYDFAKMYEYYKAHPAEFKDISGIVATPTWEGAQRNTKGFKDWNTQFNATGLNKFFGWDESAADYYGPTTSARRDFLDYIRRRDEEPPGEQPPGDEEPPGEQPPLSGPWKPIPTPPGKDEITFKPLKDWNTSPLWNGALLGNTLAANQQMYDNVMRLTFHRPEAPVLHDQWNSDYTYQNAIKQQQAQNYQRAAQLAGSTSNIDQARDIQMAAMQLNNQLDTNAALHEDQTYKAEEKEANDTLTKQSALNTEAYNQGQRMADALRGKFITAKSQKILGDHQAWEDNLNANRIDQQTFNQMDWLNQRDQYESVLNDYKSKKEFELQQSYQDSQDLSKNAAFKQYVDGTFNQDGTIKDASKAPIWAYNYLTWKRKLANSGKSNYELLAEYIQQEDKTNWLTEDENTRLSDAEKKQKLDNIAFLFGLVTNDFTRNKEQAKSDYYKNLKDLGWYIDKMRNMNPLQYSGQHSTEMYRMLNPHLFGKLNFTPKYGQVTQYKSGGTVKEQKYDRFQLYLEHNRKSLEHNNGLIYKYRQESHKSLERDLNALDKETLILLRELFK